jgi:dipeptidyl aminopeptidase/acylaminoacyl peptidase
MRRFPAAALVVAAGLPLVSPLLAAAAPDDAEPRLLTSETLYDMETISGPAISPDGGHVIFTRGWVDRKADRPASNLWVVSADGRRVRELTSGSSRDSAPLWAPDGERVAFLSDRDGTTQIHVLWVATGEIAQLTRLEQTPRDLAFSPDGERLAFVMTVPQKEPPLQISLPPGPKGAERAKPPIVIDRASWARDGRGYLEPGFGHVFVLDARLGGTPRQVTDGDYDHSGPAWSADGETLYVSGIRKPDAEYLRGDSEIYAIELESGAISTLTERKGPDRSPTVSPDGRFVAYTGYDDRRYTSHVSSVYVMDAAGEGERVIAGDLPASPSQLTWAADSSGVYFLADEQGSTQVWFAPREGTPRRLTDGVHVLGGLSVSRNGRVATTRSTFHQPDALVAFDAGAPERMEVLVDVNRDVLDGLTLGEVEELRFRAPDGLDLQGWLIKPAKYVEGRKYPLLLWIHGGPWAMYDVGFNWAWQNFAAREYAVLYMNPRGSTGYGQDFVNGIQYAYPGKDYDDLMAGVDAAIARGFVDTDNLFVCGGSGGGVLTAWIVGHTDRFRAAVSMRPVINWHSFVGTTDGISWYDQFESYPWEDPQEYFVRSPLSHVANVKTPTMVMTGEADLRTPMGQSEEYYRALKVLRKDTVLVRVPEEYHGWRRPSNRLSQQLYLMAWFEKWATDGAWSWREEEEKDDEKKDDEPTSD